MAKFKITPQPDDLRKISAPINGKKGGRPKGYSALEAEKSRQILCERLSKEWVPIVDKAIEQAKFGDHNARVWLAERGYGKVKQDIGIGEVGDLVNDEKRKLSQTVIARLLGVIVDSE